MSKIKKFLLFAGALMALGVGAAACSNTQTEASTCAYVIQNGYFDAKHVKEIALPGQRVNNSNVTVREVPCNARNYIVTNSPSVGDLHHPIGAKTNVGSDGEPGTPVDVQLSAFFTLNENRDALLAFLPFCEKYDCFNDNGNKGSSGNQNYASNGWNGMLAENMQFALIRSVQHALLQFPPNVWNDQSLWPKVADAVSSDLDQQLQQQTGSSVNFFCASGATEQSCPPIRVTIEHIDPTDPSIRTIYDQEVEQSQQQQLAKAQAATNAAELNAARQKYGDQAAYYLGMQDTIAACKNAGTTCVINLGNGSVSVAAK